MSNMNDPQVGDIRRRNMKGILKVNVNLQRPGTQLQNQPTVMLDNTRHEMERHSHTSVQSFDSSSTGSAGSSQLRLSDSVKTPLGLVLAGYPEKYATPLKASSSLSSIQEPSTGGPDHDLPWP